MSMIGKTLAHYQVTSEIGKGGMGEVYQAKDSKLGRDVAIKVLPEAFAKDADRVARFQREAKLLASLNHPNIAAIYGLEESEGVHFLVLELIEGDTLAERIKGGPIDVEESLKLALQIAEALEAAHEKGVIHRDLKPANIKVTPDGKVKVLDFGLAKAFVGEQAEVDLSQSPTLSQAATQQGIILGTAAYMSPEQASGEAVDKRTDIWAFGVVLFEMLTGKQLFTGDTVSDILAAVLREEPDLEKVPPKVRPLLQSCLEKNTSRRLRDMGDAWRMLETAPEITERSKSAKQPWLTWSAAVLFLLIALSVSYVHFAGNGSAENVPAQLQMMLPDNISMDLQDAFVLSPDGRRLAFAAKGPDGVRRLWVRALDSLEIQPLQGTESKIFPPFFWSPDCRFVAFDAGGRLKKVDISGSPPVTLCDLSTQIIGGSWNSDGMIVFGTNSGSLMRIPATGGNPEQLTKLNSERQEISHYFPVFLPDGQHFLYWCKSTIPENMGIYIGSLDSTPEEQNNRQLVTADFGTGYLPSHDSRPGQLLFIREQTLMAQPFDESRLVPLGDPEPIAAGVGSFLDYGLFSASANGVLVYKNAGSQLAQPTWFDRQGKSLGKIGEPGFYRQFDISPDGRQVAVSYRTPESHSDIWLLDLSRSGSTRFTFGNDNSYRPVWSPDEKHIVFASNRETAWYDLYQKPANLESEARALFQSEEHKFPTSWSMDGNYVLYTAQNSKTGNDLWVLPLEGGNEPRPFLKTEFHETTGHFSPDMRWVAFVSNASGSYEIYVQGFSQDSSEESFAAGGKWQVSIGGGLSPRWSRDGKQLYYRTEDGTVMAVDIAADVTFSSGTPKPLFSAPADPLIFTSPVPAAVWDVTPDGSRFLLPVMMEESASPPFNIILNWGALLKQ